MISGFHDGDAASGKSFFGDGYLGRGMIKIHSIRRVDCTCAAYSGAVVVEPEDLVIVLRIVIPMDVVCSIHGEHTVALVVYVAAEGRNQDCALLYCKCASVDYGSFSSHGGAKQSA